jgi:NAD(P)-dependent dehydrogenase (short-subunit alcohol dehydrogenase family)
VAEEIEGEAVILDLADLSAVRDTAAWMPDVNAVACNTGIQIIAGMTRTKDGLEETFAVNHLAHLALVDVLLGRLPRPRRVVFISSATHDPERWTGTPAPVEDSVFSLARPDPDAESARTAGMRRYATTKLLAVATSAALAREHPDVHVTAFDPGLLPGTRLARQHPAVVRALWGTAFTALRFLPFASSPVVSGAALAALLCDDPVPARSGAYLDYRLREVTPSQRARDVSYQEALLHDSRLLLQAI